MAGLEDQPSVAPASPAPAAPEVPATAQPDLAAAVVAPAPADAPPSADAGVISPEPASPEPKLTLLQQHDAEVAAEVKPPAAAEVPADAPKPENAAAAPIEPAAAVVDPAAPIDYFKEVTIPEAIKLEDAQRGEFTGALDALRTGDLKGGVQKLMDMHNGAMQQYADHLASEQQRVWSETNQNWVKAAMADPVLGGAGHKTAMAQVAIARDAFVSRAAPNSPQFQKDLTEFNQFLEATGAGNHPAFLKMMHNAARYAREATPPPPDPGVPRDIGRAPGRKGLGSIYKHPTSNPEH